MKVAVIVGIALCSCGGSVDNTRQLGRGGAAGSAGSGNGSALSGAGGAATIAGGAAGSAGSVCSGCETDPNRCGPLLEVCASGHCLAGTCREASGGTPVIAGQRPLAIAVDDSSLYWLNQGDASVQLLRCAKRACSEPTVMIDSFTPNGNRLQVTDDAVWFGIDSGVGSCSKAGCAEGPNEILPTNQPITTWATDGTTLVFSDGRMLSIGELSDGRLSVPPASSGAMGGVITDLALRSGLVYGSLVGVEQVLDSSLARSALFACPLTGCTDQPLLGRSEPYDRGFAGVLAVSDERVTWLEFGIEPEPSEAPFPTGIWLGGGVFDCALPDCASGRQQITGFKDWVPSWFAAADATGVYFSAGATDHGSALVHCAADACDPQSALIGDGHASGIALDATDVYWGDQGYGAIFKRAR